MDALDCLLTRRSVPPAFLAAPGPDAAALDTLMRAAVTAPDHGHLTPWRFRVLEGEARRALGDLFAQALQRREPDAPEPLVEKERQKPCRAPTVIVVSAEVQPDIAKVPPIEQHLAAGAAIQNMLVAAHALGLGAIWTTGANAYDDGVKAGLGLAPGEDIVGFVHLGTPTSLPPARPRPDPADFRR